MKLNKILMALAATAVVGCTSDDLNDFSAKQAVEDSRLIELNENFVLAGVSEGGSMTRTHWAQDATTGALVNEFLPILSTASGVGDYLNADADLEAQAVGLCWLGQGAIGTDVYTNYQFYHFGWLNKGETEADLDKCGELYNGSLYDEITFTAGGGAIGDEADKTDFTLPAKSLLAGVDNLNYNSGVYKTDNKSIFGGQYIVYYPFNQDFEEAGTIPAVAETNWVDVTDWQSPEIGLATFRYSAPVTIEGGYQAANFGLYNLSSIARLKVSTVAGDGCIGDNVDQIVLYSASQKLLKKAYLAADKIAAGATGADLYADTEGTKTIVASLPTVAKQITLAAAPTSSAFITVLPTTVPDLVAFVHNVTDGTWAQVELGNTEFTAGSAKVLNIVVKDADFTTDFIAVDEASLTASLTAARAVPASVTAPQTITVIGDIELGTATYNINTVATDPFITIKGDAIIVPEGVTLNLNTNMESEVRVLGTSCCSGAPTGGRVDVQGGTISDVTLEPSEARVTAATYDNLNPQITYSAAAEVVAGKTVTVNAGNVNVNAAVEHKADIEIAEGAKLTVNAAGDLNFMGSNVTNDGIIEVMKGGKYDMTDANGNATATDGQRMTNNGKFIHNVDAGVGTAVQSMVQNGEYRCKVDEQIKLDDAFLQWTACSVIEMVNTAAKNYNLGTAASIATPYQHNGKYIDIEVNSGALTTFNNPTINTAGDGDGKEIKVGNLTVTAGGLDIVYKATTNTGKRTLTVNGDMTVNAATTITSSKKINVTGNLTVDGAGINLTYKGGKTSGTLNNEGFAVTKDITVIGANFNAAGTATTDVDALNITCANFYLEKKGATGATATFANRTDGGAKNMVVSGTISNPEGCTFTIYQANQDTNGSVLAWVTCTKLEVGGTFSAARPRVVAAE